MHFLFSSTYAQKPRILQIGDTVTDVSLHNIVNYRDSTVNISDFKGKLLILDFWATWCTSCIEHFPFLDSMSIKYPDKLAVIGVGYESSEKIKGFFSSKKSSDGKRYKLSSIVEDTTLSGFFPHRTVPHVIWIKPDQIVGAITSGDQLTEPNILEMISSGNLQVSIKKDVDVRKPLHLATDFGYTDSLLGYSILYKAQDLGPGKVNMTRKIGENIIGKVLTNYSLLEIYRLLASPIFLEKGQKLNSKQVFVNTSNRDVNKLHNSYCFDFIIPTKYAKSLSKYAIAELNRLSGFQASICKYKTTCLVLKAKQNTKLYKDSNQAKDSHLLFDSKPTYMRGYGLQILIDRLNELSTIPFSVVNGTGLKENVALSLSGSNRLMDIRHDLQKYGLFLVEEEREIDALVITKNKVN